MCVIRNQHHGLQKNCETTNRPDDMICIHSSFNKRKKQIKVIHTHIFNIKKTRNKLYPFIINLTI